MEREWLKDIRINKKISQTKISSSIGISQQHYCNIELGIRNPSVKIAQSIAAILNFDWTMFYEKGKKRDTK